ncbi:hypothetical protein LXL04_022708 [Taraxacum kok-saghyz]
MPVTQQGLWLQSIFLAVKNGVVGQTENDLNLIFSLATIGRSSHSHSIKQIVSRYCRCSIRLRHLRHLLLRHRKPILATIAARSGSCFVSIMLVVHLPVRLSSRTPFYH